MVVLAVSRGVGGGGGGAEEVRDTEVSRNQRAERVSATEREGRRRKGQMKNANTTAKDTSGFRLASSALYNRENEILHCKITNHYLLLVIVGLRQFAKRAHKIQRSGPIGHVSQGIAQYCEW